MEILRQRVTKNKDIQIIIESDSWDMPQLTTYSASTIEAGTEEYALCSEDKSLMTRKR